LIKLCLRLATLDGGRMPCLHVPNEISFSFGLSNMIGCIFVLKMLVRGRGGEVKLAVKPKSPKLIGKGARSLLVDKVRVNDQERGMLGLRNAPVKICLCLQQGCIGSMWGIYTALQREQAP